MGERTLWLGRGVVVGRAPHGHLRRRRAPVQHLAVVGGPRPRRAGGRRSGPSALRRLVFHIAAFEAMKGGQPAARRLRPRALRRPRHRARSATLWSTVLHHVWGQWRYEHDLADYDGPDDRRSAGGAGAARSPSTPPSRGRAAVLRGRQGQPGGGTRARGGRGARTPATPTRTPPTGRPSRSTPSSTGCSTTCAHRAAPALGVRRPPRRAGRAARARARHPVGDGRRDAQPRCSARSRSPSARGYTDARPRPRAQRRRRQPRVGAHR